MFTCGEESGGDKQEQRRHFEWRPTTAVPLSASGKRYLGNAAVFNFFLFGFFFFLFWLLGSDDGPLLFTRRRTDCFPLRRRPN